MGNAASIPPGVTVFCDPTLAPGCRALDAIARARIGAPVSVLAAPAGLMLAQLQRHTRNDVLFTLSAAMDQAERLRLVRPETRMDGFANALVLAALAGSAGLSKGSIIAVTDDTPASGLDGRAVLAANGFAGARVIGAANTADVAFLIATGAAEFGLVYRTDVQADPRLTVVATLTADPALTRYAAAVNAKAVSPNAGALLSVMRGVQGRAMLREQGLEIAA